MPRGAGRAGAGSSATRLHWAVEPTVRGGSHRFYERLGKLLDDAGFDAKVEELCAPHYAGDDVPGRPFSPHRSLFKSADRTRVDTTHRGAQDDDPSFGTRAALPASPPRRGVPGALPTPSVCRPDSDR